MSDIEELQNKIIAFRDARDWKQFHNPKDVAISLVLEAGELLEHFQWKTPEEIQKHIATHKNEVNDELIDVLYWILLLANDLNVDIQKEFERKMKTNDAKYPVKKSKGQHNKYTDYK